MKKNARNFIGFICLLINLGNLSSCKKEPLSSTGSQQAFTIQSAHTQVKYNINLWYPLGYLPSNNYHVVYLLDGDDYFKEATNLMEKSQREDIILIGIGYTDKNNRGTDYSFPKDKDFPSNSGGAKEFIKFINTELIPKIEGELDINSKDRTLFGHSLGGYFALYLLFQQEQPNPFQNSIVASANIMWKNAYLFELEQQYYNVNNTLDKKLYMAVGDLEGASINLFFNAFKNCLLKRNYSNFTFKHKRLENISHRNSPIISFKNALSIIS